jgi:hypothetical protein
MRVSIVLGAVALLAVPMSAQAQECRQWGQQTELSGILVQGVFPGPPEFTSVADGDAANDALLLYLESPICVDGSDDLEVEPVGSTELVQLACSSDQIAGLKSGEQISVSGKLMSAHTGYHVTPALLACE